MSRPRARTRLPRSVPVGQMRRNLRAVQRFRLNFVFGALLVIFFVLLGRLGKLQLLEASTWKAQARDAQRGSTTFRGLRGRILDARGRTLVTSRRVLSVAVDPHTVLTHDLSPGIEPFSRTLALLLDEDDGGRRIYRAIRRAGSTSRHVHIRGPIEDERVVQVLLGFVGSFSRTVEAGLAGLKVEAGECRTYPNGDYARHVIGRPPDRSCGRRGDGIEGQCDADLLPSSLSIPVERVYSRGLASAAVDPLDARGRDVQITLDIVVQHYAETELDAAMEKWQATEGTAIVIEPGTGHVLALVSRHPSDINVATVGVWAPGSLLKPVFAAKALDGDYVRPDEILDLSTPHRFVWRRGDRLVNDFHPLHQGNVVDILAHSSNIGAAVLFWRWLAGPSWREGGEERSFARAIDFLREIGFYGPSGLELPGGIEAPIWPRRSPENPLYPAVGWAYGKGVATSPLKVLCAVGALAREDGRILRPTLIPGRGGGRRDLPPLCRRHEDLLVVREGLREVVRTGTAHRAFEGCALDVCAKTGTAVVEGSPRQIAGLIGFAPAERPRLAVLVMVEVNENTRHPDHGEHQQPTGGVVSGPPARALLERTLAYLDGRALEGVGTPSEEPR